MNTRVYKVFVSSRKMTSQSTAWNGIINSCPQHEDIGLIYYAFQRLKKEVSTLYIPSQAVRKVQFIFLEAEEFDENQNFYFQIIKIKGNYFDK